MYFLLLVAHSIHFRYVYKFVCDLQSLLGYSPEELQAMVAQQQQQQEQHQQQQQQQPSQNLSASDTNIESPSTPPISQALKREVE